MKATTLDYNAAEPEFPVYRVPEWRANFYQFLSVRIWGGIPSNIQRKLSAFYASNYNQPYSRHIIKPYIRLNYKDKNYLQNFKPPNGKSEFESFQDFFIREFNIPPKNNNSSVWPCEGLVCDKAPVAQIKTTRVKSDVRTVAAIFGLEEGEIPEKYHFSNIFLHNKNYHRIHAPVDGTISRIQHIPGDLVVLRPWIYKQNPSLPAFRNERYNIDITDTQGKIWYLSIVGGPAVGTVKTAAGVRLNQPIKKLDELAVFYLGSTCCMAAPHPPKYQEKNSFVAVGLTY